MPGLFVDKDIAGFICHLAMATTSTMVLLSLAGTYFNASILVWGCVKRVDNLGSYNLLKIEKFVKKIYDTVINKS